MLTTPACRLFAVALALLLAIAEAAATPYGSAQLVRLDSGRPGVRVVVNERGPFLFVVDTATTNTVFTPALFDRLRPPQLPGPPVDIISAAGSVRSHYYAIGEIAVAGVIVGGGRAVVMALPEDPIVMGILGAEFLSNFKVDLDLRIQRMTLYPENGPIPTAGLARLQGYVTEHGLIVVPARIEGIPVSASFDSGGRQTIANTWLAAATGHFDAVKVHNRESWVRDVARRRFFGQSETFARIQLGPLNWYERGVLISDIKVFDHIGHATKPAIFIGMDLMAGRRVIIDYAGASLWLQR